MKYLGFTELPLDGDVTIYRPEGNSGTTLARPEAVAEQSTAFAFENVAAKSERLPSRSLRATTLSFENFHSYGTLFADFLRARNDVFVEQKRWAITSFGGFEFDQYDTPASRWIAIHEYGEVLAGVRLLPTITRCGMYSYMIRDAQLGLIEEISRGVIFFPAPSRSNVVEASRIFVKRGVPAIRRLELHAFLFDCLQASVLEMGASHVLGIVPKNWARWFRRLGRRAVPAGPKLEIGNDICQAVILNVKSTTRGNPKMGENGVTRAGLQSRCLSPPACRH